MCEYWKPKPLKNRCMLNKKVILFKTREINVEIIEDEMNKIKIKIVRKLVMV